MHGRRKWQPTPVFLPRETQGLRDLVGCRLRGRTELDMTEATAAAASSFRASQVAQWVKNLPAMLEIQETQVQSLGWEDALQKGMATHSSILALRILWTKEPSGYSPWGCKRVGHN